MWSSIAIGLISIYLSLLTVNCKSPLEVGVENLFKLLKPVPPKGVPFPKIPGPNPNDRVCIVGAGPSGIHMALSLKKKGYNNVTIYEKTGRVGGKSYDIKYHDITYPQGTFLVAGPSYFDSVVPLIKKYSPGELVEIVSPNVWRTNSYQDPQSKLSGGQYIFGLVQQITKEKSPKKNLALVLQALGRYIQLHKELFGSYEGALMQKPTDAVFSRISGTFLEFLKRENLSILTPLFSVTQTSFGYGHLDETSAVYGLMWNEPRLILSLVLAMKGLENVKAPFKFYFLKNGYESLWKNIAQIEDLDIHFNADIYSVKRKSRGVDLMLRKDLLLERETCDFLIWTAPMPALLKTLVNPSYQEYSLFSSLKSVIYTANLVNMNNDVRNGPYVKHFGSVTNKVEHGVVADVDIKEMLKPDIRSLRSQESYNCNNGKTKTSAIYQLGHLGQKYSNEKDLNARLIKYYQEGFNATNIEIINTISWQYFPRWSSEEANQRNHWKVFEMQGLKRMWYAGSSVSFESIKDVVEYNNLLLTQMFYH